MAKTSEAEHQRRTAPRKRWLLTAVAWCAAGAAVAQVAPPERPSLGARPTAAGTASTGAPEAALYDEAAALLETRTPENLERSLQLFSRIARRAPGHATAHAGAATAASLLALYSVAPPGALFGIARTAAAEALRLDPTLAQAHAATGLVAYLDAWDFAGAEASLREALRLDERYATAWHWYGMLLLASGRLDESVAAFDRALALEPSSTLFRVKRAAVLHAAGRSREAETELRRAIGTAPESQLAHRELGYLLLASRRGEEGVASMRRAAELTGAPEISADLAWAYGRTGRSVEAGAILGSLIERAGFDFVSPLDVALAHVGLDRRDEAFLWIERALELRDPGMVYLRTAPGFAPLRVDPRFATALARVGLPSSAAAPAAPRTGR